MNTPRPFVEQIDGYDAIAAERQVLEKYGTDFRPERGAVRRIIDRLHPDALSLRVAAVIGETPTATTLRLVSDGCPLPPFQAGQYINLHLGLGGILTSRPYSISSSPHQGAYYDITVRKLIDGFVSAHLVDAVLPGDVFTTSAPTGQFVHNPVFHGEDLVFLAGGSGITPFMSMIRDVTDRGLARKITLIYGSRHSDDIIFSDELARRVEDHDALRVIHVISEPDREYTGRAGFITADLIREAAGDLTGKMFYICGPEVMYAFCLKALETLGVPRRRIRTEVFGPPVRVTDQPGWPIAVAAQQRFSVAIAGRASVSVAAGEPLMIGLERNAIVLPALCRSGECSLCRTRLVRGEVFQPAGVKVRASDRTNGYIHPCMAYPVSDLQIELPG
ncbi:MAG: FAD-binding oxidoreductase [Pseudomonadota bacterium]